MKREPQTWASFGLGTRNFNSHQCRKERIGLKKGVVVVQKQDEQRRPAVKGEHVFPPTLESSEADQLATNHFLRPPFSLDRSIQEVLPARRPSAEASRRDAQDKGEDKSRGCLTAKSVHSRTRRTHTHTLARAHSCGYAEHDSRQAGRHDRRRRQRSFPRRRSPRRTHDRRPPKVVALVKQLGRLRPATRTGTSRDAAARSSGADHGVPGGSAQHVGRRAEIGRGSLARSLARSLAGPTGRLACA